jgi:sigma-B regulation protein RsbU (phosphoserine phosphatase)
VIQSLDATIVAGQAELIGVLYLDSRAPTSAFSSLDREVLRTLAREAATVVENARLFASARAKQRLDHEIQIASQIQQRLLPTQLPNTPELTAAGSTLACYSVGGDCFDVIDLGGGRFGFFVGDVSGKGVSAALMATLLQGVFFTTAALDIPICDIFSRVSQYLSERTIESRYATVFYGVLSKNGELEYVNAGHVPPFIRRHSGTLDALSSENLPVGLFPGSEFKSAHVKLQHGEFLVIYTDGVTEAANTRDELFEESRLQRVIEGFSGQSVEELATAIRDSLKSFTEGSAQSDDITLLVVQYKGDAV